MPLSPEVVLQEESVSRREPRCLHFGDCGGCQSQQYDYNFQLMQKQADLQSLFAKVEALQSWEIPPVTPSPLEWFYRNKMEFTFGKDPTGQIVCGLHRRGAFDQIVPLVECSLFSEVGEGIRQRVQTYVNQAALSVYHPKTHEGFLRTLVVRKGEETEELLVNLVTNGFGDWDPGALLKSLADFPQIVGVLWSSNTRKADAVIIEDERCLAGRPFLYEQVGALRLKVSSQSFLQTNTLAAEKLYAWIQMALGKQYPNQKPRILDLYSGSGGIALFLAASACKVMGVDLIEPSIQMARENAALNHIENTQFVAADVRTVLNDLLSPEASSDPFDVVVLDPPRAGVPPKVIKKVMELAPRHLICVSCEPKSLTKNLKQLLKAYQLVDLQAFDLFPHTKHIETVVLLSRNFS